MFRFCNIFLLFVSVFAMWSCGSSSGFKVEGEVEGLGTQNLRIVYRGNDAVQSVTSTAVDSKFSFSGTSKSETVVEVFNNSRVLIGRFIAKDGDKINVKFQANNPYFLEIKGNRTSAELAAFLKEAAATDSLNRIIEKRIAANPSSSMAGVLLGYYYDITADHVMTDSLLGMIDLSVVNPNLTRGIRELLSSLRTQNDTIPSLSLRSTDNNVTDFFPSSKGMTLYLFENKKSDTDSLFLQIDPIADKFDKIACIRTSPDTVGWSNMRSHYPKKVTFLWAPQGLAERQFSSLSIQSLPLFIIADSTKIEIWRGNVLDSIPDNIPRLPANK